MSTRGISPCWKSASRDYCDRDSWPASNMGSHYASIGAAGIQLHCWLVLGLRLRERTGQNQMADLGVLQCFLKNRLHDIWQGSNTFPKEPALGCRQVLQQYSQSFGCFDCW